VIHACVTRVFTRAHSLAFVLPPRSHRPAGVNTLNGRVLTRLGGGRADANLSGEVTKMIAMKERTEAKLDHHLVEDTALLAPVGGVGALLRYRL
jgi:hypothetical protein